MAFSELKNLCGETGLDFSEEYPGLYGKKNGFFVAVEETDELYTVDVFCGFPENADERQTLTEQASQVINSLAGTLPKNTVKAQQCASGVISADLDKYCLFQENAVYLIDFLEALTKKLAALGISPGEAPVIPPFSAAPRSSGGTAESSGKASNAPKKRLVMGAKSLFGLFGALLGAAAVTVIASFVIAPGFEALAFGLAFEPSAYITAAAVSFVSVTDYRFLAKRLDVLGVLCCPVISAASVFVTGLTASARAIASETGAAALTVLSSLTRYLSASPDIDKFVTGFITRGVLTALLVSAGLCVLYFRRHPGEMISDKPVSDPKKPRR